MSDFSRFMEADGLLKVLDFLAAMDYDTRQSSIHTALLGCTKALMNNSVSILLESLTYNMVRWVVEYKISLILSIIIYVPHGNGCIL